MTPRATTDPFTIDRGPAVLLGSGHAACWLHRDGARLAAYGQVLMLPQDNIERQRWQREYHRVLLAELTSAISHLQAALIPATFGLSAPGWAWPEYGDWLRPFIGDPIFDAHGRPDGPAALAHLTALAEQTRAELASLDTPTVASSAFPQEPKWPPPPAQRQAGVLYGDDAVRAALVLWDQIQRRRQAEAAANTSSPSGGTKP
jgi:hypothetical protein